ncbi:MAG TPA: hypothetical protein PL125_01485 [Candidatus Omnitrophota bacterium]|mgnify:CR=1 FL=1|nr:hypothetical protein [Candidatus Omnitrophota bacterium]HPT38857.1 hypothetical protein [Candidatus Omnitrophota bacterium]
MPANRWVKIFTRTVILLICLAFIVKFAGPNILRQYISYGIGNCKSSPILCMQPDEKIFQPQINTEYRDTLIPHAFPRMTVSVPKGFTLVQELIKQRYYKKRHPNNNAVIYLLIQEPDAFIKLYPDVQKQGIKDNYEFINRLMYANLDRVNNITDAFFIIMKSIFTPDVGNQSTAKMIKFEFNGMRGFINYSMAKPNNYFDCNVSDPDGNFFKVYIKDIGASLDLNNVFAIISTLKPVN